MTLLWRAELRRGWRGLLGLAVVVAVVGAVVLAALAGARRTSSSFDRFIRESRSQDAIVFAEDVRPADVARIRAQPGVEAIGYLRQLSLRTPAGEFLAVGGALDDSMFRDIYRARIVAGRRVTPGATDEVVVGEPLARKLHLRVGAWLPLRSYNQGQIDQILGNDDPGSPAGPHVRLRVVGISRAPIDLSLQGSDGGLLLLSREFVTRYGDAIGNFSGPHGAVLLARLRDGNAGVPRFLSQLRAQLGAHTFDVDPAALSIGGVQDSIDLLAVTVLVLGLIAGIAALIALTLVIGRQIASAGLRQGPARDLGLTRRGRALAAGGPVLLTAAVGALGAAVGAWLASPLFPFGVAARAEPDPGLHFDALALGAGTAVLLALFAAIVAAAAWRATRAPRTSSGRGVSRLARILEGGRLPPATTIGVRLALEPGRGSSAVPVRSSLLGTAFAVFGVVAVAVFGASLAGLGHDPRAFGRSWDVTISDGRATQVDGRHFCAPVATRLAGDPAIDALAAVCNLNVTVDGRAIGAYAIRPIKGAIGSTIVHGRAPRRADEVALGSETLRALGRDIGDTVTGRASGGVRRYHIVGQVVVPSTGDPQALADGAVFTTAGLDRIDKPADTLGSFTIAARFRDGADRTATIARIRRMPEIGSNLEPGVVVPATPLEVDRLRQVERTPAILAGFLALVGTLAVGHLLVTSVQRRRRDFAVLKTMGFTRRQVARTVSWQATSVASIGTLTGGAAGLVAGTVLWRAAAARVGVLPVVELPVPTLVAIVLATFLIANVVAAIPARTATSIRPAVALHGE